MQDKLAFTIKAHCQINIICFFNRLCCCSSCSAHHSHLLLHCHINTCSSILPSHQVTLSSCLLLTVSLSHIPYSSYQSALLLVNCSCYINIINNYIRLYASSMHHHHQGLITNKVFNIIIGHASSKCTRHLIIKVCIHM